MPIITLFQPTPRLGDFPGNLRWLGDAFQAVAAVKQATASDASTDASSSLYANGLPDPFYKFIPLYPALALSGHSAEGLAHAPGFRAAWEQAIREAAALWPAGPLPEGMARLSVPAGERPDLSDSGPAALASRQGARALLVDAARPYRVGGPARHEAVVAAFCLRHHVWWLEANLAGAQNETVMAGGSLVVDPAGAVRARAAFGRPETLVYELSPDYATGRLAQGGMAPPPAEPAALHDALVLATRAYLEGAGAAGTVLGLSGGIDSAVVAALAVQALGPDRVTGLTLPSRHTSAETLSDAHALARNLGIRCPEIGIATLAEEALRLLGPAFAATGPARPPDPEDITGQNLQARSRMLLLMAYANRHGLILLNTSNKSEALAGYGTLYGDMAGGYAPLGDVYKTEVWDLAREANRRLGPGVIPQTTIDRPPTAELRPGQKDSDSLPPYDVMDAILKAVHEGEAPPDPAALAGFPPETVARLAALHRASEHKRRQSPPHPLVQPSADWHGRRNPVTHQWRP